MSDDIDVAQLRDLEDTARAVAAARRTCACIEEGDPGVCSWCGYAKERLVGGACAQCRDEFKLE